MKEPARIACHAIAFVSMLYVGYFWGHADGHRHAASVVWMLNPQPEQVLLPTGDASLQKFHITGIYRSEKCNDCTMNPVEVTGTSRLDALARMPGLTVWTAEEWAGFQERYGRTFREGCDKAGKFNK